ncbi:MULTISPECIES: chemotaxis protein CheW [unclassified Clostridioides]|uniref:chemotaxis protein CheW n=1 Tax=unclassified Clostridioides TaxID=2635829 RepID=UPI001D0C0DA6|nr:chemotaxis protein CheW [Clostridioides sp. ES-S-0001-02]MCC0641008.1 chemotaxis protein CheW [Clostridioides sp. ES-S-0049-03]MCC0654592.1 chemotaxis protein CheW [Clostridioides sp. ES-S-0001-03]MCC0656451.1 chemotaxis protein CheW [Clostridioides sp. ES-S-0123-01]MCC0675821.1 chemotaxis protein CheW [Clostridioides sp. ES-W-0018-02]MCC0681157.1 chemotaxis protein CheW [Clostridioides sp. ES-S-0005-03]MCC0696957.1 chemotaxis protein CheW [Clostridioides sp. ES-S-0048-02]MCC0704569.1 che
MSTNDIIKQVLTFYVNDVIYGIELENVIETIRFQPITYVPRLPNYINGVINLRGRIIPVIDMHIRYNLPEVDYNERTCIIIIKIDEYQVGIIVDKVVDVVLIDDLNLLETTISNNININKVIKEIVKVGDKSILILDIRKFLIDSM